ncbi:hypothetical protein GUJ93_ZPchr0001g32626 [Zizania palustris]|uniref:Uncharacterized protein n=1 Tax=Zizania palustris TaxID=103762 RepID=A0A8J5RR80_ZIZPA|nr:hypothetical protein GUJ93_ZPchr0001g32626 [Zizania palustris]
MQRLLGQSGWQKGDELRRRRLGRLLLLENPQFLVTPPDTKVAGGGAIAFSKLPAASSQDGHVGEYLYFATMSAYFDDEQQYKAAKAAAATTHLKPPPPPTAQTAAGAAAAETLSTRSRS